MTCILRIVRHATLGLTLVALLAVPLAASAAPPEPRAATSAATGDWPDLLRGPWRALQDLVLSVTGASGTGEDPPPPPPPVPPEEDDDLQPPTTTTCPNSQTPGGCTDPTG